MAAITPSAVITENLGNNTLYKISFTTINDADTYASTMTNVYGWWANGTNAPTQNKEGIDVGYTQSTGSFVFYTGEDGRTGDLYVLCKI